MKQTMIYIVTWCLWVICPCPNSNIYDEYGQYQYTTSVACWEKECDYSKAFVDLDSAKLFIKAGSNDNLIVGPTDFVLDSMTLTNFLMENFKTSNP